MSVKIKTVVSGTLELDGGAMFGVVPKKMWKKLNTPDEDNMCTWAMRCLVLETGDRKILVDTGIGDKQSDKFRSHFGPKGLDIRLALAQNGIEPDSITDVFLTHLHFDHVGGAVIRTESGDYNPTFPEATYWSNKVHWDWALDPNPREKASFLKENIVPLMDAGVVKFLDVQDEPYEWLPGIKIECVYGHTAAMMLLHIDGADGNYRFCADLIPSRWHVGLPYVMAYDVQPLKTLEEKARFLDAALAENATMLFEHDPSLAAGKLTKNDRGRIVLV